MMRLEKKIMPRIIIGAMVFCIFSITSFALVFANTSDVVFEGEINNERYSIKKDVINGGGYFLKAYSDILLFLNKIELAEPRGLNFEEINTILDSAIENMERLKFTYSRLCAKAEATPYNQSVLKRLKKFDYISCREKNALNPIIFNEVKLYLSSGNIRGVYYKILSDTENILSILKSIKEKTTDYVFPPVSDLWKLNQYYSDILLFGKYVAIVCCDSMK
jgi:hypothetical protein